MSPTPETTLLQATAEEAYEFWTGVSNQRAYWEGARDTLKQLHNARSFTHIAAVRRFANKQARIVKAECDAVAAQLREQIADLHKQIAERDAAIESMKAEIAAMLEAGHTMTKNRRAVVWEWAIEQPTSWRMKDLRRAFPQYTGSQLNVVVAMLGEKGHLHRSGTTGNTYYAANLDNPYEQRPASDL